MSGNTKDPKKRRTNKTNDMQYNDLMKRTNKTNDRQYNDLKKRRTNKTNDRQYNGIMKRRTNKTNGRQPALFRVFRGIRQGCPASALIFILAVEIMAIKLRETKHIRGIE